VSAVSECLGYGWLPKHQIQKALDNGSRLKVLPLQNGGSRRSNFYLIHARSSLPSPQASQLAEFLHSVVAANV
jgi:DNA-binding transcriptional LysR family regulator